MKVICPACERLSELSAFRVDGEVLLVTCVKCGVESRVELAAGAPAVVPVARAAAAPSTPSLSVVTLRTASVAAVEKARLAAETDPFEVPAATCPRCLARRADTAESCPTCGVVFAQLAPATLAPPEWLAAAWRELLLRWDDEPLHEQLRARAYEEQELATLGRLYRLRLAWNAEDPWAQQGRDEVLRLATAPVALVRPERPSSTFRYVVVGALLLGVLVVFIALVRLVLQSVA